jgi:hypothetical protein
MRPPAAFITAPPDARNIGLRFACRHTRSSVMNLFSFAS